MNTDFQTAYLKSLNLIKQEEEEKKEKCKKCGKEPCECEEKETETECGDTDKQDEVISDDVDEEKDKDAEEQTEADDAETSDDSEEGQDKEDGDEQGEDEESATCFCFKTTNKTLIDAINSGFDKVVFTVKAKDDEGNDTTTDVEFTSEDFVDFGECEEEQGEEEGLDDLDNLPEDDEVGDITDEFGDVEDGASDEDDNTSFESVFKKYYGAIVGESKKNK